MRNNPAGTEVGAGDGGGGAPGAATCGGDSDEAGNSLQPKQICMSFCFSLPNLF